MGARSTYRSLARLSLLTLMFAAFSISHALAFCLEPSMFSTPPSPPGGYSRPSAPPCLSGYKYSSTHTYGQWEVDNYIAAINRYIGELNDYADEAVQFANTAIAFAKEAERFTNCEARDVKREIE